MRTVSVAARREARLCCVLLSVMVTLFVPGAAWPSPSPASGSLNSLLPASVRQAGVLRIGGDATFPPFYYLDKSNEFQGFDVDLANAVAKVLGVKAQFTNIKTEGLLAGIQAGRFDLGMSGLIDRPVREKVLDFVDYYRAVQSLLVKAGNPSNITPESICGKEVAVGKGTAADIATIPALSQRCEQAGKPSVKPARFPDYNAAVLAVESGRAPASLTVLAINRWIETRSNGRLEDAGVVPGGSMIGIGILKGNRTLVHATYAAVERLMADGTYQRLLAKYNILKDPLDKPAINHPNPY